MIPVRLKIHNFKSFEDEEIDFEGLEVVAISGDNGAGKTSIVDAITWALWGEVGTGLPKDSVIHKHEKDVNVELDFDLNDNRYRVIRKRTRSGTASFSLYKIPDINSPDQTVSLTAETMSKTTEALKNIIHLDYETFTNSSFLRQGHSDEFSSQSSSDQKSILSKVLSLDMFERYENVAKEKKKEASTQIKVLEETIGSAKDAVSTLDSVKKQYQDNESLYNEKKTLQKAAHDKKTKNDELLSDLKQAETKYNGLLNAKRIEESHLTAIKKDIDSHNKRIEELDKIVARKDEIDKNYKELTEAKAVFEEQNSLREKALELKADAKSLKDTIETKTEYLNKESADTEDEYTRNKTLAAGINALEKEQEELAKKETELEQTESFVEKKNESKTKHIARIAEIDQLITSLKDSIAEAEDKLAMLSHTEDESAHCPLCDSELGHDQLQNVEEKYHKEISDKEEQIEELKKEKENVNELIKNADAEIRTHKANSEQKRKDLDAERIALSTKLNEAKKANDIWKDLKAKLDELKASLADGSYIAEETARSDQIEKEFKDLGYKPEVWTENGKKAQSLEPYNKLKFELDTASGEIARQKESLTDKEKQKNETEDKIKAAEKDIAELNFDPEKIKTVRAEGTAIEAECSAVDKAVSAVEQERGRLEQQIRNIEEQQSKVAEKTKELDRCRDDEKTYSDLVTVFGAKGIRALMIEAALPDLNNEANKLLGKMTDGLMTLEVSAQTENKDGSVAEALNIKIYQNGMDRDYASYSGGERFRIDLALRIAMSRLMTNRIGAPMQTLIIDEGFGTQDENGIDKVIYAINSIKDDFRLIMVITHIEALKDAFPNKIVVTKDGGVSHIASGEEN
ncbi:MAG: SMC family ATPase [Dehalococcoidales bacterium]|nr:SMC family ATPase [Dehalococcoidales bacterium]